MSFTNAKTFRLSTGDPALVANLLINFRYCHSMLSFWPSQQTPKCHTFSPVSDFTLRPRSFCICFVLLVFYYMHKYVFKTLAQLLLHFRSAFQFPIVVCIFFFSLLFLWMVIKHHILIFLFPFLKSTVFILAKNVDIHIYQRLVYFNIRLK